MAKITIFNSSNRNTPILSFACFTPSHFKCICNKWIQIDWIQLLFFFFFEAQEKRGRSRVAHAKCAVSSFPLASAFCALFFLSPSKPAHSGQVQL